jgi:hypothetical protein
MLIEGVWAEIKVGGEHLIGLQIASVYAGLKGTNLPLWRTPQRRSSGGEGRRSAGPSAGDRRASMHRFLHPLIEEFRDFEVVPFEHHHMAVAVDSGIFEPHACRLRSCLVEPFGIAVIVHAVVARF